MTKDIFDVITYYTYFIIGLSVVFLILDIIRYTKFSKRLSKLSNNYKHIRIGNTKDLVLDILGDKGYSVNLLGDGTERYTWSYRVYTSDGVHTYNCRHSVSVYFKDGLVIEVSNRSCLA